MLLVEVVPLVPLVSDTAVPSTLRISDAPSATLVTVRVKAERVWPLSTVEALVPENSEAAAPPSVKVGSLPVAVRVGSSLIAATVTATLCVALSLTPDPSKKVTPRV